MAPVAGLAGKRGLQLFLQRQEDIHWCVKILWELPYRATLMHLTRDVCSACKICILMRPREVSYNAQTPNCGVPSATERPSIVKLQQGWSFTSNRLPHLNTGLGLRICKVIPMLFLERLVMHRKCWQKYSLLAWCARLEELLYHCRQHWRLQKRPASQRELQCHPWRSRCPNWYHAGLHHRQSWPWRICSPSCSRMVFSLQLTHLPSSCKNLSIS